MSYGKRGIIAEKPLFPEPFQLKVTKSSESSLRSLKHTSKRGALLTMRVYVIDLPDEMQRPVQAESCAVTGKSYDTAAGNNVAAPLTKTQILRSEPGQLIF